MTAKVEKRIGTDRTPLQDVIPLNTPYLVFLDPSDACNAHCAWCPSGQADVLAAVGRKPQLMRWDVYCRILTSLLDMPNRIKTLRLYKDGEPLLNPAFPDMVRLAKDCGKFGAVDTTTNGTLLSPEMNDQIVYSGLDKIFISVPMTYNQHYINKVADLFTKKKHLHIHCKMVLPQYYPATIDKLFKEHFQEICDTISLEYVSPCWPGVRETPPSIGIYGQAIPENPPEVCPYVFYSMAINSDGTVSRCFLDWKHDSIVGDLKTEHARDVWTGENMRWIRFSHLRKQKKFMYDCRDCKQLVYGAADNIDRYAQTLSEMNYGKL